MAGTASISGIASGIKSDEIIAKIMDLERAPVNRMQAQKALLTNKLTAWQEMNTRILAFKLKADTLANPATFQAKSFASSDTSILTGTVYSTAQAGTYYLKVTALAKTHQLGSQGFADTDTATVGTGTISITLGSEDPVDITIDSSNNTLQGVRDAINRSNAGVTASIINDGSAGSPYRLMISSKTSGEVGEFTISDTLVGGTAPTFNILQQAQNSSVTFGEGINAITVEKSSNTVSDLITGVVLDLQKADADKMVTVTVSSNTTGVKQNITDFVTQYNNLVDFFNSQSSYNVETKTGGLLLGDTYLRMIQNDMTSKLSNSIAELGQTIKSLSQIGITLGGNGKLNINQTDLDAAVNNNLDSVRSLFATVGGTNNINVSYVSGTANTKPSSTNGYAVAITALDVKSRVTAGVPMQSPPMGQEIVTINGVGISIGANLTYDQIINRINEFTDETGVVASRTGSDGTGTGNYITLQAQNYGSSYHISVQSTFTNQIDDSTGFGNVAVSDTNPVGEGGLGTGVTGSVLTATINGEETTRNGLIFTGKAGNANTEGLRFRFTGTPTIGSFGTITFTRGVGGLLADYVNNITDLSTGAVSSAQSSLQSQIYDINNNITNMEARLSAKEARLVKQFVAMESALAKIQSQSTYLSGQINQISKNWKQY